MPRRAERIISWHASRSCWKKTYRGRTFYMGTRGTCAGPDDLPGYERALAEWFRIKARVDREGQQSGSLSSQAAGPNTVKSTASAVAGGLDRRSLLAMATDYSTDPDELPGVPTSPHGDISIADAIEAYCVEYRERAARGERAISTYRDQTDSLADFLGYSNRFKARLLSEVDARLLRAYRSRQHQLVGEGRISPFTIRRRLRIVKRWLEWCYAGEYIDRLPRPLDRHFAQVELPDPKPNPLTDEQVRMLFMHSVEKARFGRKNRRTALYLLLGLNCGYRSIDIATLEHAHIDWTHGAISRLRHKTKVPQVHKLWPITADFLRGEMTDPRHSPLALLSERGVPLVKESLDAKTRVLDSVMRAFNRLRAKAGITGSGNGHSSLRVTGSTWLKEAYPTQPLIRAQYRGHKMKSIEDHYAPTVYPVTSPFYTPLFDALDAMNDHFDLANLL